MAKVVIMDHPLIQHKIGYIRRKQTGTKDFRQTIGEIAMLICYEATRELQLSDVQIETPGYDYGSFISINGCMRHPSHVYCN